MSANGSLRCTKPISGGFATSAASAAWSVSPSLVSSVTCLAAPAKSVRESSRIAGVSVAASANPGASDGVRRVAITIPPLRANSSIFRYVANGIRSMPGRIRIR